MRINRDRVRQLLKDFEFETLFIEELGWDRHSQALPIRVNETEYSLTRVAEKRGMVVFYYSAPSEDNIPSYAIRRKIEREVARSVHEHLIIYTDHEKTPQIWQWVRREAGRPAQCREQRYNHHQHGESLIQKLEAIAFSLDEEEGIGIVDVTSRVRAAFDVEKITRRFYDYFKKEHDAFLQFLEGIPDEEMQRWYVSVILNRLMFIYFIQKKNFLNGDPDYLRNNLQSSQQNGMDQYYKAFLCPLFFEGFAKPMTDRTPGMENWLGDVPYLNGGIFQKHQIEEHHGERIQIPDAVFERLFDFFDHYQWHLDDRPLRNDNEINPDVLGYIFEKYINQKQMGAYYTKEDITEYISKNTIIPFLLDSARKKCEIAFEPPADSNSTTVWQLLVKDPNRYIYDAVKHGTELELPPEIAAGTGDVSARTGWNTLAPSEYALPTESWREVVARRERYEGVRAKLANREIYKVDDLITYNLNIRQFAQDIVENCEGPDLLRAFWKAIKEVTILDPTCGSGAFLFAALNILEPLYEACLDRMGVFVDELQLSVKKPHPKKFADFREILDRVDQHPNHKYFILKSIIINNLYGVDIMEEAIEICKLRLFLKMVAQVDDVRRIEPLPDIDFNIKAGNTLVGYTTTEEVEKAVTSYLPFGDTMQRIRESAEDVEKRFNLFRQQQTNLGGEVKLSDKQALQAELNSLEEELSRYLAWEYKVNLDKEGDYQEWLDSHKPFHWFTEFYGILKKGGFDVIIGNPPYVEFTKVKKQYTIREYESDRCGNLYAYVTERGFRILNNHGSFGFIVPLSLACTQRMVTLQRVLTQSSKSMWLSNFAERPSKLFVGADVLVTISLSRVGRKEDCIIATTEFIKWTSQERSNLFNRFAYHYVGKTNIPHVIPKISSNTEWYVFTKLSSYAGHLQTHLVRRSNYPVYYRTSGGRYWKIFTNFQPRFILNGRKSISSKESCIFLEASEARDIVIAILSSSLFYWYYILTTNCRDLSPRVLHEFPLNLAQISTTHAHALKSLCRKLMAEYEQNSKLKEKTSSHTGNVLYQEFYPRLSKAIIDEIDAILAQHYGFTDEELDFIINYDIKYRMGLGSD